MGDLNKDSKTDKERQEEEQKKGEEWQQKQDAIRKQREEEQKKDEEEQRIKAEERERKEHEEEKRQEEARHAEEVKKAEAAKQAETQPEAAAADSNNEQHDEPKQLRKRSDPSTEGEISAPPPTRRDFATNDEHPSHADDEDDSHPTPAPAPGPAEDSPQSYTLCSPQLLHLDTDGTPLWFNGWLLDNKFADKSKRKFGTFKHYLIEPGEVREPGAWQLHENNECCLTVEREGMRVFSKDEVGLLDRMMAKARVVGAPGA